MFQPTIGYSSDYDDPWYSGSAVADPTLVPGQFQVAISGHPYILNTDHNAIEAYGQGFKEQSLPLLRDQADQGKLPGDQSLSPTNFWRRSQDDWRSGTGQSIMDRDVSDVQRFSSSLGINPWTHYQATLLNDTSRIRTSANTGLVGTTAGGNFYVADGTTLTGTANLSAFTTVTGTPASQALDLASDGSLAYAAFGASGIYTVNGSVATSYVTGTVSHVWFVKNRLICSNNQNLYNPIAAGGLPGVIGGTAPTTTGLTWAAACEGDAFIYVASVAGDTSRIWRIATTNDAGTLTGPIVAASLPKGELVRSLLGYLGFVIVGTDRGVRFATASATGDLTLGALIPTPGPVYCLDAYDRFVWFGWSNFDASHTGLGRMDLTVITDGQAPAYASDVMALTTGTVRGMGQLLGRHVFAVDASGVWAETTAPVASGWFTTGQITYGIADAKIPLAVDLKHAPLPVGCSVSVGIATDRGAVATIGASSGTGTVGPAEVISTGSRRAGEVELTLTLNSSAGVSPTLTRWTLLSYPTPDGASKYTLPLILNTEVTNFRDAVYAMDPYAEYQFLRDLNNSRTVVTIQVGESTFNGTLEDFIWIPDRLTDDQRFWNGTFIAQVRRISG